MKKKVKKPFYFRILKRNLIVFLVGNLEQQYYDDVTDLRRRKRSYFAPSVDEFDTSDVFDVSII